jgi:hypothetical protein
MRGFSAAGLDIGIDSSPVMLALVGDGVLILGNGEVKLKDADRRFLDLTEPDGEDFPLKDVGGMTAS